MNPELKVTVYWGDILYDTALCQPKIPFTVGTKPGNSFIMQLAGRSAGRDRVELVTMLSATSAEVKFDEEIDGHVRLGDEILPLHSIHKTKALVKDADGFYRLTIGERDRAELVIGHVSFYVDWTREHIVVPKNEKPTQTNIVLMLAMLLSSLAVVLLVQLTPKPEVEVPPERIVTLLSKPPKRVRPSVSAAAAVPEEAAKASVGARKTADGGAAKGDLGKAALVKRKPSAAESLKNSNLGSLVKNLSSLGGGAPAAAPGKEDNDAVSQTDQQGTGGFSTEGLKTGGGGKSVGLGRTVGQGEGGFGGTGRLGLSGTSLVEGGTGKGGNTTYEGGLDKDVIDAIVRRRQDRIRLCYERQLNFNPKLSGKVSVRFTIGKKGSVVSSSLVEDTMRNENIKSCILSEVNTWTFPPPVGGTLVTVDYPFVFESSAHSGG